MPVPKALTVAGSDSSGGAGIQADLKTFAALGVYGCSVITAITAQNTREVTAVEAVSPLLVRKQLEAVLSDIQPVAMKSGMLGNAEIVAVVAATLKQFPKFPFVLDPVMVAKSGHRLLSEDAVLALRDQLMPLADLVTPNIPEAEVLTGKKLDREQDFEWAVREIASMGPKAVLLKGGHRPPRVASDSGDEPQIIDLFADGNRILTIAGPRIDTPHTHGTGCTLAAAIVAGLALGLGLYEAVLQAREYLTRSLASAFSVGHGKSPVHHFHDLWKRL
jgi:hydroxymethylpyrimidine/phosphomethylpyrimidine kinase